MVNDRYRLGDVIGTGGMSEVYRATDSLLGRDVAIKMLRPEMARDVNFRERFRKEAQNSGRLNHPNIVAVYDTGEADEDGMAIPYIVMELVHGRTLRDLVREDGPLSPREAAQVLIPVAHALQASHDAGIIHRDVKPANIMITNTGQVKVMDFGIARALDDSTSAMTQTSAVIGTAQYLSPEQAQGKPADARSDVYALGCVLYEAVTGHAPFEGETPFAVAYQHVQEEPNAPSESLDPDSLTPTERVNLDAVVLTSMAKDPMDRYQSAQEFGADLERMSSGNVTRAAQMHIADDEPSAHSQPEDSTRVAAVYPATTTMDPQPAAAAGVPVAAPGVASADIDERNGARKSRPWMKWIAIILAIALAGLLIGFAFDYWNTSQQQQAEQEQEAQANMVTVPNVEDRPRSEVIAELEDLDLLVTVNEEANPDIARDNAIRINPAPGSQLQRNSTVILTVSSGREITELPSVVGLSLEDASRALSDAGLSMSDSVEEEESSADNTGRVTQQNPPAGSQLSRGSRVTVTVGTGPRMIRVPSNLVGQDIEDVRSTLDAMGFDVQVENVDSTETDGQVLSVSDEGNEIPADSTVTVRVSNGQLIVAPDLVRQTPQEAEEALRDADWSGSFNIGRPVNTGSAVDSDLIAWASVSEGDSVRRDADIEIRLWEFNLGELIP
ncbi:Stk1 family PASTA domain-containing Ser/Thr kinase [Corynebacterium sp.]|uniref:Stk1 family PASTA domain-containing Ser/Thr kinase n=1 Tax=Corynebacterium sp. TaxID=1720 RepID=UPI002647C205|nr:Stk1 family PASTA domain-containing Ser/Thr kinase [Corynebacterium sp.]MDN6137985.1 Stk1 family PASTA domain-containing Ser/Thr kinase [Corynebacterium sp.]MDN6738344.1 Stk1 family PASTA domain-containing Ser/Thr kinase [Corynebacterium sp.]